MSEFDKIFQEAQNIADFGTHEQYDCPGHTAFEMFWPAALEEIEASYIRGQKAIIDALKDWIIGREI
jgi:hypothetical protein